MAASRRAQLEENELRKFLRDARPEWRVSQVITAENKLRRININSLAELLRVLKVDGHLDELFNFHGEKAFPEDTLKAILLQATSVAEASPAPTAIASVSKTAELQPTADAESKAGIIHPVADVSANSRAPDSRSKTAELLSRADAELKPKVQARRRPASASAETAELPVPSKLSVVSVVPPPLPPAPEFPAAEMEKKIEEMKEFCKEKGFNLAWAEQMAVEELKKERTRQQQFANWKSRKAPEKEQRDRVQQSFQPAPRKQAEDVEWFCVVFSKVFVKKAPDEKAKSWGFVYRGQMLEAVRQRASDARGREWVELTQFELWRSCLRTSNPEHVAESDDRAFCLIDGADMKLGALLSGPVPRIEWPVVSPDELRDFAAWLDQVQIGVDFRPAQRAVEAAPTPSRKAVEVVPRPAQKAVEVVSRLAQNMAEVAPTKSIDSEVTEELVHAELGIQDGWVKIAVEPGVVGDKTLNDGNRVKEALSAKDGLKLAKAGAISKAQTRDKEVAQGADIEIQYKLRQALANADEAPLAELRAAIIWAKAFGAKEDLIITAEQKLAQLEEEGEYGRMVRQARSLLEKAQTEQDLRSLIERCESTDLREVVEEAQAALDKLLAEQALEQNEHAALLERFKAAIRGGQAAEIKALRDSARAAGVPKKELARVFALAQEETSR